MNSNIEENDNVVQEQDITENEDYIRPPDNIIREQLMEDTRSYFDIQMEEALFISSQEKILYDESNKKYEDEIITNYYSVMMERNSKFTNLIVDLKKLRNFDKDIKEILDIIEPIIEMYCSQYIEQHTLNVNTYNKIFSVISTIRTNKTNVENLKTILTF